MLLRNKPDNIGKTNISNNILTSKEECYCYGFDASNKNNASMPPDKVIFVENTEDVQKTLIHANKHKIPVISRGAGTNMVGACLCPKGGIVLNFSKMNKILEINPVNMTARVQPGVILGDLKSAVEEFGLFFPPDPSNYKVSTIGGAIAQSSGGARSLKYGTTKDYVVSMKVVTADGKLMTLGAETSKDSVGYNLSQLIVGSEGTLAVVVEALLKLIPMPEEKYVLAAYFDNTYDAVKASEEITTNGILPAAIEYMDNNSIKTTEDFIKCGLYTKYDCLILVELDGNKNSIPEQIEKTREILEKNNAKDIKYSHSKEKYEKIWRARQSSFAASARIAPDVISDDIIVPRENITKMIDTCKSICDKYNLNMCLVGHLGDGNLHPQIVLNTDNEIEFENYMKAKSEIYSKAIELNGTISAEHGVGLEKISYFENYIDKNSLEYMKMIKKVFDPNNILNPGKIFNI